MAPDPSKLLLYSGYNSFKNVDRHTGSLTFPTSIAAGTTAIVTSAIILTDTPVLTQFFTKSLEEVDAVTGDGSAQWYVANLSGNLGIGVHVTAPSAQAGWNLNANVVPVIDGSTVTITGSIFNPNSVTVTIASLTVPFVFVEYTLAN